MDKHNKIKPLELWSASRGDGRGTEDDPYVLTPQNSPDGFPYDGSGSAGSSAATSQLQHTFKPNDWTDIAGGSLQVNSGGTYNTYLNPPPDTPENNGLNGSQNPVRGHVNNDSEIYFTPPSTSIFGSGSPFDATINVYLQKNNPSGFLIYASALGWYDWSVEWWPPGTGPDARNNTDGESIVKMTYKGNGSSPSNLKNSSITVNVHGNPWDIPEDEPHFVNSSAPGPYPGQGRGPWHCENNMTGDKNGPLDIGTKYDDGWHVYSPWGPWPIPCFLKGALIRTSEGLVPVEKIKAGDKVQTFPSGEFMTVLELSEDFHEVPEDNPYPDEAGRPVIVEKGALGFNLPSQDLALTPEHCLFIEGAFVPVRMLVNDKSIYFDFSEERYAYYHIKLEKHAVIQANGILTESYLSKDQSWEKDAAAPLRTERSFVEPIWKQILYRYHSKGGLFSQSPAMGKGTFL